jgi:NTE family protein
MARGGPKAKPVNNDDSSNQPVTTRELLRDIPMFQHLDDAAIARLEGELEWFAMPGGAMLFDQGDEPDALYVLRSGSLGAFKPDAQGILHLQGVVAPGETVGEIGLLINRPRSAQIRTLRDSELLRLSRRGFESLVAHYPEAMLSSVRLVMQRQLAVGDTRTYSAPRTFAILPHDTSVDAHAFADSLRESLVCYGNCAVIDADAGQGHTSDWFNAIEMRHRYVIYVGNSSADEWRELCARQADCFILLADSAIEASAWVPGGGNDPIEALHRPRHLVLLHHGPIRHGTARKWLDVVERVQHHHVRDVRDIERIARLLTGRSLGLVLSGGGARGFAHIGIVRALRQAGMRIDSVGGTSIGAIIGAGVAADWSDEEMHEKYRRAFVDGKPLSDYTFPFVSLFAGRRVSHLLREAFGTVDIEDLALPYYAVTANLTSGNAHVHRAGPLWLWLRASCAIPGVLPPVFHRGEVYVDGAVMNNLPVDTMRAQGVSEVVAVDISADDVLRADVEEFALPSWWRLLLDHFRKPRRPGILSILLRSGMVNAEAASIARRAQTSLLLTPKLNDIELLDWHAYDRAIEAGYRYACDILGRAEAPRELP